MNRKPLEGEARASSCMQWVATVGSLGIFSMAGASAAQFATVQPNGPLTVQVDHHVAVPELAHFLPTSGVETHYEYRHGQGWQAVDTLSLFAVTDEGLASRYWRSNVQAWSDWASLGNPMNAPIKALPADASSSGMDVSLPLLRGWDASSADWIAYQGVVKPYWGQPTPRTAILEVDAPKASVYHRQAVSSIATAISRQLPGRWSYFHPASGLESVLPGGTNRFVRHVFGTAVPGGRATTAQFDGAYLPLIEMRHERGNANPVWVDHGLPPLSTNPLAGPYTASGVEVGPNSTVSVTHDYSDPESGPDAEESHYVFVSTTDHPVGKSQVAGRHQVKYLRGDGQTYRWHHLGTFPAVYGAPVATSFYTKPPIAGGLGEILVFQPVHTDDELCTTRHDGIGWDPHWTCHSPPNDLGPDDQYTISSAVVWHDGPADDPASLRVHAFGHVDPRNASDVAGLVEFRWDGMHYWAAEWSPIRFAPDGEDFRTTSAQVLEVDGRVRIVVLGRTSGGRIFEFVQEFEQGQRVSEEWNDLSFEPLRLKP